MASTGINVYSQQMISSVLRADYKAIFSDVGVRCPLSCRTLTSEAGLPALLTFLSRTPQDINRYIIETKYHGSEGPRF